MTGLLAFDGAVGIAIGSLIRNRSLSVIGDGPLTEHDRALGIHTLEHSNDDSCIMIHGRLSLMLGARPILDSVKPSCEGRPPAFQASRATRHKQRR
jgi:hypothetical protein